MKQKSPEETNEWVCPACGNAECFVGIDVHGFGGDDCCENDRKGPCREFCQCETVLWQDVDIIRDDAGAFLDVSYDSHDGGCSGAVIGSYTTIRCALCNHTIWTEEE